MRLIEMSVGPVTFMTGDELEQYITKTQYTTNNDVFDRLKYLFPSEIGREDHFVVLDNGKIIASLAIQVNPYDEDQLWLKHVVVDENYRNQGLATKLIDALFKYLQKTNLELVRSTPTEQGQKYIQPIMQRYKQLYPNVVVHNSKGY